MLRRLRAGHAGSRRRRPPAPAPSATSRGRRRPRLVGAQGARDLDDVRRRRHVVEVELGDLLDVVEHGRQLGGHPLDLVVAELAGARGARRAGPARGRSCAADSRCRRGRRRRAAARAARRRSRARRALVAQRDDAAGERSAPCDRRPARRRAHRTRSLDRLDAEAGWVAMRSSEHGQRHGRQRGRHHDPPPPPRRAAGHLATAQPSASSAVTTSRATSSQPSEVQPVVERVLATASRPRARTTQRRASTSSAIAPRRGERPRRRAAGSCVHRELAGLCARGQQRVAQQAGDRHRPDAAGDRRDRAGDLADLVEVDVARAARPSVRLMPTSITIAPGLTQSPRDQSGAADGRDQDVGAAADRGAGRACASGRSSRSRWRRAAAGPSACRRGSSGRRRPPRRPRSSAPGAPRAAPSRRAACTAAGPGGPSASSPALTGVRPSTSLPGRSAR